MICQHTHTHTKLHSVSLCIRLPLFPSHYRPPPILPPPSTYENQALAIFALRAAGELLSIGSLVQEPLLSCLSVHGYHLSILLSLWGRWPLGNVKQTRVRRRRRRRRRRRGREGRVWMEKRRNKQRGRQREAGEERMNNMCQQTEKHYNTRWQHVNHLHEPPDTAAASGSITTNSQAFHLTQCLYSRLPFNTPLGSSEKLCANQPALTFNTQREIL